MLSKTYSVLLNHRIKEFNKTTIVDADKSISIRSFLIGAIGNDISKIKNVLMSEDVNSCIMCLKKLGIKIKKIKDKEFLVYGKGLGSLAIKKNSTLDFGIQVH